MSDENKMTFKSYSPYENKDIERIEHEDNSILNNDVDKISSEDNGTVGMIKKEFNNAIEKLASTSISTSETERYPSPYLSLADMKIPESMSEIFDWCRYYYKFDPVISGAVEAKATFPITEITVEESKYQRDEGLKSNEEDDKNNEDSAQLKLYRKTLFEDLKLYKLLVEIGIDYWAYGNVFVFGEFTKNEDRAKVKWKTMYRIPPNQVIIDRNAASGDVTYKWIVPKHVKKIVKNKKPIEQYEKIPEHVRTAVNKGKSVIFNNNNLYHFSKATDSMGDSQWGSPPILNVLKLLMYRNTLRRAQEAIAMEHMVPLRVYYFEELKGGYNPTTNWDNVRDSFKEQLRLNAMDPNRKIVSPIPVNVLNLGGHGKGLLLTAEIEQIQSEILAGLGVPREFIFGGVSWSGSSVSLRILENNFATYRLLLEDFIQNFIIKGMAVKRKEWVSEADDDKLVTVKMAELKMQDDVQQKQLVLQLHSQGKVTNNLAWQTLGLDPEKMAAALQEEARAKINKDKELQLEQLKAQFEVQKKQMEIEAELRKFKMELDAKYNVNQPMVDPQQQGGGDLPTPPSMESVTREKENPDISPMPTVPAMETQQQIPQQGQEQPVPEQQVQQGGAQDNSKALGQIKQIMIRILSERDPEKKAQIIDSLPSNIKKVVLDQMQNSSGTGTEFRDAESSAIQLMKLPAEQREKVLSSLPAGDRTKIMTVIQQLTDDKDDKEKDSSDGKIDMRPLPTQRPARRPGM